jgi:hypothetical protein
MPHYASSGQLAATDAAAIDLGIQMWACEAALIGWQHRASAGCLLLGLWAAVLLAGGAGVATGTPPRTGISNELVECIGHS